MTEGLMLADLSRSVVFWTLLFAGFGKLLSYSELKLNLVESFKVPAGLSAFAAISLIAVELSLAAALLLNNQLSYWAMVVTTCLFVAFTILIATVLFKEKLIRCNCFGNAEQPISGLDLFRNLLLIAACTLNLQNAHVSASLPIWDTWLLWGAALILVQLLIHLNEIKILFMHPFLKER